MRVCAQRVDCGLCWGFQGASVGIGSRDTGLLVVGLGSMAASVGSGMGSHRSSSRPTS